MKLASQYCDPLVAPVRNKIANWVLEEDTGSHLRPILYSLEAFNYVTFYLTSFFELLTAPNQSPI